MAEIVRKSFDHPEETRSIPNGKVEVVDLDGLQVMRATFEPSGNGRKVLSQSSEPIAARLLILALCCREKCW